MHDLLESIRYRGPDHLGIFAEDNLAMGNIRLAIQDVAPRSNQPIYNEDRSVVVVYNGEIYNTPELRSELLAQGHEFSTGTDTELLVHLYEEHGMGMADQLNGMFAFALYDRRSGDLLLGRDRCGQKPLFIHQSRDGLFFCSELSAMRPHLDSSEVDAEGLRQFLSLGYAFEPRTILRQVKTIEPGTIHRFSSHETSTRAFSRPRCNPTIGDPEVWVEQADSIFRQAVSRHLLSDVPVTIFLSGGIDSTLMAIYAAEAGGVSTAYTGSFTDCASHDEYRYAARLGAELGLDVIRVPLDRASLAQCIPDLTATSSQPVGDTSTPAAHCLARETASNFRVVLGGDGGDELFAGYPTYRLPGLMSRFGIIPKGLIDLSRRIANRWSDPCTYMPLSLQLQQLGHAWGRSRYSAHFHIKNFLHRSIGDEILSRDVLEMVGNLDSPPPDWMEMTEGLPEGCDAITALGIMDMQTFLRSGTIPKMERQCMRFSLENRLPFLDNEVLALSHATKSALKLNNKSTKHCLKVLAARKICRLGNEKTCNPIKQGFTPPMRSVLDNELREWRDALLDQPSPYFSDNLRDTFRQYESAGFDLHRLVWCVCALKSWLN